LTHKDGVRREAIQRLNWLALRLPKAEYLTFPGGLMSKCLFEEARDSFVYGQFLATIVLGFAFVERTLAALFQACGLDDTEQETFNQLLQTGRSIGWVTQEETDALERARLIRSPETYVRRPARQDPIDHRSAVKHGAPYTILEEDARHIITVVMNLLAKQLV
jgi:hypothetical protein